jgi:ribonuclease HII
MTEKQRKSKIDEIYQKSIETQGILRDAHFINEHGIMGAWESAFVELVGYMLSLGIDQSHIDVIVDGAPHRGAKDIVEKQFPELSIQFWAKADDLFPHVSAASVMAKVYRDSLMVDLSREFPEYLWERNKGYGTPTHIKGLDTHGYTEYHREHARKAWPVRAISS